MLKTLSNILNVLTMAVGALGGGIPAGRRRHRHHHDHRRRERDRRNRPASSPWRPGRTILLLFLGEAVALRASAACLACARLRAGAGDPFASRRCRRIPVRLPEVSCCSSRPFAVAHRSRPAGVNFAGKSGAARLDPGRSAAHRMTWPDSHPPP